ncbi:hypothetical protein [Aquirufa nivalisilvae]|uniref:hypothetical protein n=1 Tax=Aquirufa nivalisilvae TaxID=2516557 RepID=UPI0022A95C1F|nr:hypothetical protein [Aquirufa nivalisilvae]MCZ2480021.1 hypothetical protein [Aquirufa nivalisilvae]
MPKPFSYSQFEDDQLKLMLELEKQIKAIYNIAISEASKQALQSSYDPTKPFSFDDYPRAKQRVEALLNKVTMAISGSVLEGQKNAWDLANFKNDKFLQHVFGSGRLDPSKVPVFNQRNLEALQAFQNRKDLGMGLSDRVWKITNQFKTEMELAIDVGLGGQAEKALPNVVVGTKSANELTSEVKQLLNEPNKLFRRVRDKYGNLQLSKAAQAYNPGQGVYRSSFKNAQRLTRTEINMAYREADFMRMNQLPVIVGFTVKRSNSPFSCDWCESLQGDYPKTFKFTGWHPNCRCYVTSILPTDEEMDFITEQILAGNSLDSFSSKNAVTQIPVDHINWMEDNKTRLLGYRNVPYFVRDNYVNGDPTKGLKVDVLNIRKPNDAKYQVIQVGKYGNTLSIHQDHVINKNAKDGNIEKSNNIAQAQAYLNKGYNVKLLPGYFELPSLDAEINGVLFEFENVSKNKMNTIYHRINESKKQVLKYNAKNDLYSLPSVSLNLPIGTNQENILSAIRISINHGYKFTNLNFVIGDVLIELKMEDLISENYYWLIKKALK